MLKKRITASILALILCLSGITNVLAEDTDSASDRLIIGDYISEPITKFAFNPASSSLKEVEPADGECEKRAADKVLKFYWGANKNPTGYLLGNNSKAMYGDVSGYNYINMWVYCDAGNESTSKLVDLIVKTGADENKKDKAFRYRLDLSKWNDGWNLISLDMKSPTENIRNAEWSGGIWNLNLAVGNYGAAKWTQGGAVYLEKLWFSKSIPAAEFRAYPSIENEAGYVPADLGGDRTFVFNMSSSALSNDAEKQIEVYKGNDKLSDGYTVAAEGSELKVIFNENLEKGFEYTIKLLKENEGRLFVDLDGNILKEGKEVSFMVEAPSKTFKITSSDPQDGETDVDADLKTGGGKTNTVTISTNNPIETVQDINNIVRVYKSGALIKDGYTALYSASQENQIEVVFDGALESGTEYSISLNNLTDIAGTKLSGKNKISFTFWILQQR